MFLNDWVLYKRKEEENGGLGFFAGTAFEGKVRNDEPFSNWEHVT